MAKKSLKTDAHISKKNLETLVKTSLPNHIINTATNFIDDNFDKEAYNGSKWQQRKRDKKGDLPRDSRRGLLVKSGDLRKSIKVKKIGSDIVIGTDVPYAQIHNEGGTINKGASIKVLHFRNTENDWDKQTKKYKQGTKFSKASKAHFAQKAHIGAHSILMPKRQFMPTDGEAPPFQADIDKWMNEQMDEILG